MFPYTRHLERRVEELTEQRATLGAALAGVLATYDYRSASINAYILAAARANPWSTTLAEHAERIRALAPPPHQPPPSA